MDGNLEDRDALREALRAADFDSVRGAFRYNQNHFPIQSFYLREVVQDPDGAFATRTVETIYTDHADPYASACPMTW